MATYRKATEKDISKGKGKSTDELSLAEATAYFNKRSGETGAKKFGYKGEVYDLSGNKSTVETIKPSTKAATPKPSKPAAPEKTVNTVRPEAPSKSTSTGGGGADAGKMPATGVTASKKYSGRGSGAEVARRRTDAKKAAEAKDAARKAQEDMSDRAKAIAAGGAALGAAVLGGRAVLKGAPKTPPTAATTPATSTPANPAKTGGPRLGQNKTGGPRVGQSKPAAPTVARGAGGGVSAAPSKTAAPAVTRGAGGGVRLSPSPIVGLILSGKGRGVMDGKDDKLPLFSKGGMVTKGKK